MVLLYKANNGVYQMNEMCCNYPIKMSACEPIDICDTCAKTPVDTVALFMTRTRVKCTAVTHNTTRQDCQQCDREEPAFFENMFDMFNKHLKKKSDVGGTSNNNIIVDVAEMDTFLNISAIKDIYIALGLAQLSMFISILKAKQQITSIVFKNLNTIKNMSRTAINDLLKDTPIFNFSSYMNTAVSKTKQDIPSAMQFATSFANTLRLIVTYAEANTFTKQDMSENTSILTIIYNLLANIQEERNTTGINTDSDTQLIDSACACCVVLCKMCLDRPFIKDHLFH
jgi:hypothetical protein